jgi:hypothetical protein
MKLKINFLPAAAEIIPVKSAGQPRRDWAMPAD